MQNQEATTPIRNERADSEKADEVESIEMQKFSPTNIGNYILDLDQRYLETIDENRTNEDKVGQSSKGISSDETKLQGNALMLTGRTASEFHAGQEVEVPDEAADCSVLKIKE